MYLLCSSLSYLHHPGLLPTAPLCHLLCCAVLSCVMCFGLVQPTIIAPYVPHSSRHSKGVSWMSALVPWVPLSVLNGFVGLQNHMLYKQVSESESE